MMVELVIHMKQIKYMLTSYHAQKLIIGEMKIRKSEMLKWATSKHVFLKDNIKWHDDPLVHGPGEGNCKIHKCLTLITEIHKLQKKFQTRFACKNGQKI